ncbi:hypothetical protein GCM10008018_57280 [Paenibacillus marchantiophytorum]|uniref:Uncharacterized protein n=1 Tax=Paenibacillus marchantiophytorum TaxID=1619310 RepID=A0ABQ1F923_9BACL|nr:hypothetical protein GCM10008018_57280 [Paenibacillus marchantiophytorum]
MAVERKEPHSDEGEADANDKAGMRLSLTYKNINEGHKNDREANQKAGIGCRCRFQAKGNACKDTKQ